MYDNTYYTFTHPVYYESIENFPISPRHRDALKAELPSDWSVSRSEIWLNATPPAAVLPSQGYKIHLSCSLDSALTMIERFVPVCAKALVPFKIVADERLHTFLNSKRFHRSGSGKFATIYPCNREECLKLLGELNAATNDLSGPYILSDKRFHDSNVVFYRYGGFKRMTRLEADGTALMMLASPDGDLVLDQRQPYYFQPDWVPALLSETGADRGEEAGEPLNGRYQVEEALSFTNTGGVYQATDLETGLFVVIKEARPHTVNVAGGRSIISAVEALEHERDCLRALQVYDFVPRFVDYFCEWEHSFLVMEYSDGLPLSKLRVLDDVIVMTRVADLEHVRRFAGLWRQLTNKLLSALKVLHDEGIKIGDLSPENVLFDRASGRLTLIDLESVLLGNETDTLQRFASQWVYPGFRSHNRRGHLLSVEDDLYACGMLLYSFICPIQSLFDLDPMHDPMTILNYFIKSGLPEQFKSIIAALLAGDRGEAMRLLSCWEASDAVSSAP